MAFLCVYTHLLTKTPKRCAREKDTQKSQKARTRVHRHPIDGFSRLGIPCRRALLQWRQTNPGGELPAVFELVQIAGKRQQRKRRDMSYAWHRPITLRIRVLFR